MNPDLWIGDLDIISKRRSAGLITKYNGDEFSQQGEGMIEKNALIGLDTTHTVEFTKLM